jgi:hypothetical protein
MVTAAPTESGTIVFDQPPEANDGTISYDGTAGGVLVGTDIVFQSIGGVGTDIETTVDCDGCLLNFTTGAIISVIGDEYTFAAGGSFTLVGGSILGLIPAGTPLLTGTWTDPVTVEISLGAFDILTLLGNGEDVKHPDLLDIFFTTPPANFAFVNSTIQITTDPAGVTVGPGTAFSADLEFGGNADLVNTSFVPEPGSSLLLLLGLGSLAAYRRRR